MDRKIILASGSPRRIAMKKENGYDPIIMPADIEENIPVNDSMTDTVSFLALKKALWVEDIIRETDPSLYQQHPLIIASDTIVYKDGIMGKPKDYDDGMRMLMALKNHVHYVVSGVAMIFAGEEKSKVFYDVTKVYFKDYTSQELDQYLKTDEAYDKAGGYAIQGTFGKYIDRIEGSYSNVVGFPWEKISQELQQIK